MYDEKVSPKNAKHYNIHPFFEKAMIFQLVNKEGRGFAFLGNLLIQVP